jgi:hypothetical protein
MVFKSHDHPIHMHAGIGGQRLNAMYSRSGSFHRMFLTFWPLISSLHMKDVLPRQGKSRDVWGVSNISLLLVGILKVRAQSRDICREPLTRIEKSNHNPSIEKRGNHLYHITWTGSTRSCQALGRLMIGWCGREKVCSAPGGYLVRSAPVFHHQVPPFQIRTARRNPNA